MMECEERLYLDDLAVGQRFALSGPQALDAGQIKAFAEAFDPQPFHLDEAAAASSLFGACGELVGTAAISMRLLVSSVPLAGGVVGAGGEVALPAADPAGRCADRRERGAEGDALARRPDRGTVILRSETRNQRGEVVQTLTASACARAQAPAGRGSEGSAAG